MKSHPSFIPDDFFQRIQDIISANAHEPEFNVHQLCDEAGIGRSHLHRQLTGRGKPPAIELIHAARLSKACELLRATKMNISEIAYEAGFSDPNYFSRLFLQKMGCAPTQYRERRWREKN